MCIDETASAYIIGIDDVESDDESQGEEVEEDREAEQTYTSSSVQQNSNQICE